MYNRRDAGGSCAIEGVGWGMERRYGVAVDGEAVDARDDMEGEFGRGRDHERSEKWRYETGNRTGGSLTHCGGEIWVVPIMSGRAPRRNLTVAEWRRKTSYISCITNVRIYHLFVSCVYFLSFFFIYLAEQCMPRVRRFAPRAFERDGTCPFHLNATRKTRAPGRFGRYRLHGR